MLLVSIFQYKVNGQSMFQSKSHLRAIGGQICRSAFSHFTIADPQPPLQASAHFSTVTPNLSTNNPEQEKSSSKMKLNSPTAIEQWSSGQDARLCQLVQQHGDRDWALISDLLQRSEIQCLKRWKRLSCKKTCKGSWTQQQDTRLMQLVEQHGAKNWSLIARQFGGRIGKQCRERWHNHLNPSINKQRWTEEQDSIIIEYHRIFGNKWSRISKYLPGRTDNCIKNHWNSTIRRKLAQGAQFLQSEGTGQFLQSVTHNKDSCFAHDKQFDYPITTPKKTDNNSQQFLNQEYKFLNLTACDRLPSKQPLDPHSHSITKTQDGSIFAKKLDFSKPLPCTQTEIEPHSKPSIPPKINNLLLHLTQRSQIASKIMLMLPISEYFECKSNIKSHNSIYYLEKLNEILQ